MCNSSRSFASGLAVRIGPRKSPFANADSFDPVLADGLDAAAAIGDGSLCWDTGEVDSCLYFTPQATLWILAPDEATLQKVRGAIGF